MILFLWYVTWCCNHNYDSHTWYNTVPFFTKSKSKKKKRKEIIENKKDLNIRREK